MAKSKAIIKNWGFVEGKWVYIPLWDPSPQLKTNYLALKKLIVISELKELATVVKDRKLASAIGEKAKGLASSFSKDLLAGWEDGDICPPWPWLWPRRPWPFPWPWPWPVGPIPDPQPGPDPVDILTTLPGFGDEGMNKLIGHSLILMGDHIRDAELVSLGKDIQGRQGAILK